MMTSNPLSVFVTLMLFASECTSFAQSQLIFGNAPTYIWMNGGTSATPVYLIVNNSDPNAISRTSSSSGWIVSENEYNYLKWTGTTNSLYTIPFGYNNVAYLPFTFDRTAGSGTDLIMSTWASASDNTPWASGVTNMYGSNFGGNASACCVIDRWWSINTSGTANLTFSYRGAENTTGSPTDNFGAQRWNGTLWVAPVGSNAGVTTGTSIVTANNASNFSPWVLAKLSASLPVNWLSISAKCDDKNMTIKWSTASEQNSDYFEIQRNSQSSVVSGQLLEWETTGTVKGAGNSSVIHNYEFVDKQFPELPAAVLYYRIKQTDFDGSFSYSNIITTNNCISDNIFIYVQNGSVYVDITATEDKQCILKLYNIFGQNLTNETRTVKKGNNLIKLMKNNLADGIYFVVFNNEQTVQTKKVFVKK